MSTITPNWDNSWTTTSINASSISNAGSATTSSAISHDGKAGTFVTVAATYGGTATEGLKIYILNDIDGTNYETVNDAPRAAQMEYVVSGTRYWSDFVAGDRTPSFKVHVTNNSGAAVVTTVRYKQFTIDTA